MLERLHSNVNPRTGRILDAALDGREMSVEDAIVLLDATGPDFHALVRAADLAREEDCGNDVSYVVCRNINFTNVCYVGCSFCGFARHKDVAARGRPQQPALLERRHQAYHRCLGETGRIHNLPDRDARSLPGEQCENV
jgi:FO synthase